VPATLRYDPEGIELTAAEIVERSKKQANLITHGNTRFTGDPFPKTLSTSGRDAGSTTDTAAAAGSAAVGGGGRDGGAPSMLHPGAANLGYAGDGGDSPRVGGYGFVTTPSPAPGVDMDPLMTWGEIDGTPFRLDAGDLAGGPSVHQVCSSMHVCLAPKALVAPAGQDDPTA